MPERSEYAPGTPCWVDHASPDPARAASFYGALFGWQTENRMPADAEGEYHLAEIDGKAVAALGSQPLDGVPPAWNTYIAVTSADETADAARRAGGAVVAEPFDVFEAGRMAVLADQAGAVFMVWQANDMIGAELVNEPGALIWNELMTRDVEGSKRFYGSLFGWSTYEVEGADGPYTIWRAEGRERDPGGMLATTQERFPPDLPASWNVYFAVEDADAAAASCEQLGGGVSRPPFDIPDVGRAAALRDPLGAIFEVIAPAGGSG
jgi:predicted enzyme related to lactoylglutathione lyase